MTAIVANSAWASELPSTASRPRAPTVGKTLLYPLFRIPRLPLSSWAEQLLGDLTQVLRETRSGRRFFWGVAETGNQTALLITYRGDAERALALCKRQMVWASRASRRAGDPGLLWHGVNPWSNIARLEALAGDDRIALGRFEALRRYVSGVPLRLGPYLLRVPGGATFERKEEDFFALLHLTTVLDVCKTLLSARRYPDLDDLAAELRFATQPKMELAVDEARIVAAATQEELDVALAIVGAALHRTSAGWTQVVFQLRRAELLARTGAAARATAELRSLVNQLLAISPTAQSRPPVLHILARVGAFAAELGERALASRVATASQLGARVCGDQTYLLESLRILGTVASPPQRERALAELSSLEQSTEYVRYRRNPQPLERSATVDALVAALFEAFRG